MRKMNQNIKQHDYQTLHIFIELLVLHIFSNSLGDSGNIKIVENEMIRTNSF